MTSSTLYYIILYLFRRSRLDLSSMAKEASMHTLPRLFPSSAHEEYPRKGDDKSGKVRCVYFMKKKLCWKALDER